MMAGAGGGTRSEITSRSMVEFAGDAYRALTPLLFPKCEAITLTQVINAQRRNWRQDASIWRIGRRVNRHGDSLLNE